MITPEKIAQELRLPEPTKEQAIIIAAPLDPMLIVAGAGSGKTETLTSRIVWLIANKLVKAEQILGVTFTRKASGELGRRIYSRLQQLKYTSNLIDKDNYIDNDRVELDPTIATYNSYAGQIIQEHGLRIGIEPDSLLLSPTQTWQMVTNIVNRYSGPYQHLELSAETLTRKVIQLASECSEHLQDSKKIRQYTSDLLEKYEKLPYTQGSNKPDSVKATLLKNRIQTRITVVDLLEIYLQQKQDKSVIDFGDQISYAAQIATEHKIVSKIEKERFKIVLLDEFQDTSYAQMKLFSSIFGEGYPIAAVGDPAQAIYGWRGASAGGLESFVQTFPIYRDGKRETNANIYYLSTSWRNDKNILKAANTTLKSLQSSKKTINLPQLQAKKNAQNGIIYIGKYSTPHQEAERIAEHFKTKWDKNSSNTFAVLCRTRKQFHEIEKSLNQRNIPVEIVGLGGLIETPEIVDIIAVLRVLVDFDRSDSMLRILTNARWRIGISDLIVLSGWAKELAKKYLNNLDKYTTEFLENIEKPSLIEAISILPPKNFRTVKGKKFTELGLERITQINKELNYLRSNLSLSIPNLILEIEKTTLIDIELASKPDNTLSLSRKHIDTFIEAATTFINSSENSSIENFLTWLDIAAKEERGLEKNSETKSNAVQLLTIHAAKGLEWDSVAIIGLNQGSFPVKEKTTDWIHDVGALPWNLRGDKDELPTWDIELSEDKKSWLDKIDKLKDKITSHRLIEERRLAYVAITRAKHELFLTTTIWESAAKSKEISPFLEEILEASDKENFQKTLLGWEEKTTEKNPLEEVLEYFPWPYDPLGERRQILEKAKKDVLNFIENPKLLLESSQKENTEIQPYEQKITLLLENRKQEEHKFVLPQNIATSTLVEIAENPQKVLENIRRPMPNFSDKYARIGNEFHLWVEQYYTNPTLQIDSSQNKNFTLEKFIDNFLNSSWAKKAPHKIEASIETRIANINIRGRIDAIFKLNTTEWELVDWKTGKLPDPISLDKKTIQLSLYRLAWAKLNNIAIENIHAFFYYVKDGATIQPQKLHSEEELVTILKKAI